MTLENKLLVRPAPYVGEGLRGYLLRLSEVNGCLPETNIASLVLGRNLFAELAGDALRRISKATGVDETLLWRLGCHGMSEDGQCSFLGHKIALGHIRRKDVAVCPLCLEQLPLLKASWEISAQTICPDHGVWLTSCCSSCGEPIQWRRPGMMTCDCGADFREIEPVEAPPKLVRYSAFLEERLSGSFQTTSLNELRMPKELAALKVNELLSIARVIGNSNFGRIRAITRSCV